MAVQTTPNLGLTLPYQSDPVAVSTQNSNMTLIDTAFGALPSGKTVQEQIDELNGDVMITNGTITPSSGYSFSATQTSLIKSNKIVHFHATFTVTAGVIANSNYNSIATLPNDFKPKSGLVPPAPGVIMDGQGKNISACRVWIDQGTLNFGTGATVPTGSAIVYLNMSYVTE